MSSGGGYRDDLEAAHRRIAELEKLVANSRVGSADSTRLAALLRERAAVVDATQPRDVWPMLIWVFVVFIGVGLAFAVDGDWLFGALAVAAPFAMGAVGQRISNANAAAATAQLGLVDQEIAAIEQRAESRTEHDPP